MKIYQSIIKSFPQSPAANAASQVLLRLQPSSSGGDGAQEASGAPQSKTGGSSATPKSIAALIHNVRPRKDRPPVSAALFKAVTAAVDGLPPSVKALLWSSTIQIYVTPTIEDQLPGLKYQQARGYEGGTYKSCPALFDGSIVLAEHTLSEDDESVGEAFAASKVVNALYHETGHALDYCLKEFSQTEEFKHAYLLDSAKIDAETAEELKYYLQKSEAGQQECCAELIGTLLGESEPQTGKMRSSFPLTLQVLRQKLKLD